MARTRGVSLERWGVTDWVIADWSAYGNADTGSRAGVSGRTGVGQYPAAGSHGGLAGPAGDPGLLDLLLN